MAPAVLGWLALASFVVSVTADGQFAKLPLRRTTSPFGLGLLSGLKNLAFESELTQHDSLLYTVELAIGTPAQNISVQFDTGSNELWVNPNCTTSFDAQECGNYGHYSPNASSTSQAMQSFTPWQISYGQGAAWGYYYQDDIEIAGLNASQLQFGVAAQSSYVDAGILGMGFGRNLTIAYNSILDQLVAQRNISGRQFSIALGSVDASSGELLFNAVDLGKFTGKLQKVPILYPGPDRKYRYWVNMTYVGVTDSQKCSVASLSELNTTYPVIVDSGSTFTRLPQAIFESTLELFPDAVYNKTAGIYTVDCSQRDRKATVDFAFGDASIRVPFHEFIVPSDGDSCYLGLLGGSEGSISILGDNFLRSAYAVFDQDDKSIHFGQYADCGRVSVESINDPAMNFTGACNLPFDSPLKSGLCQTFSSTHLTPIPTTSATMSGTSASTAATATP